VNVTESGARKFGRFTVLDVLGTGAMGEVLRARDERLGREVAIKTVRNVFGEHADTFKQRFDAEARALGALSHPAIVQVHDLGFDDASGEPYLVMELVDGPSLKAKLQKDGTMAMADVRGLGISSRARSRPPMRAGYSTATSSRRTSYWRPRANGSSPISASPTCRSRR